MKTQNDIEYCWNIKKNLYKKKHNIKKKMQNV